MAKTKAPDNSDLASTKVRSMTATRQRGVVPSAELIPMQFRMPPDFVRAFKQTALDHGVKLNELLNKIFNDFQAQQGKAKRK